MRRFISILLVLAMLLASVSALAEGMQSGAKGENVTDLQKRLIELGFLTGKADGIFGKNTAQAVSAFQEYLIRQGLRETPADGIADPATVAYLNSQTVKDLLYHMVKGERGEQVLALQKRLLELGLLNGAADGVYGDSTQKAVREFQQYMADHGVRVELTGLADKKTVELLNDEEFAADVFRLEKGDDNDAVKTLQERLTELGLFSETCNGRFGDATEDAVKAFQTYRIDKKGEPDVSVDGVVDRATNELLYDEDYCDSLYDISKGAKGDLVTAVQNRLSVLGFLTEDGDGEFGSATEKAVREYQQALLDRGVTDVAVNGTADSATRRWLFDESYEYYTGDLDKGSKGEEVRRLQNRLSLLGYSSGGADGNYGKNTESTVKTFQHGAGLPETGTADRATQSLIYSDRAQPAALVILQDLTTKSKGAAVTRLQEKLISYGFLEGKADGSYGKKTKAAVEILEGVLEAQGVKGVVKNGTASVAEQEAFYADAFVPYVANYRRGDSGIGVYCVEERLNALNYSDLAPDDVFDEHNAKALKKFQQANGVIESGMIDLPTVRALYSADAAVSDFPLRRDLAKGDSGKSVTDVENVLSRLGFLNGLPGSVYDGDTADAIGLLREHFTKLGDRKPAWADELADNDSLSADVQEKLIRENIPAYLSDITGASSKSQILRVQRRLYSLYYMGRNSTDGKWGDDTRNALKSFQRANGLPESGIADRATQQALFADGAPTNPTPYYLKVSLDEQRVYAFERGENGEYTQIREMKCSTGIRDGSTPRGVYVDTWPQERWHYFKKFFCWAQYTFVIYLQGDILFHSVLYSHKSENSLTRSSLYNLGRRASHGCVRLSVEDAKWVYEHCAKGTPVIIY